MTATRPRPPTLAVLLTLVPFVALGLGRFAYGLLLPPMRNDLGWTYSAAGIVTTANSLGYLLGALGTPRALRLRSASAIAIGATWATAVLLLADGVSGNFIIILLSRFGAGFSGGLAFVSGGVLAAQLIGRGATRAVMIYPAGAGAGIAFSALVVPPMVRRSSQWPMGWVMLSATAAVAAAVVGRYWWDESVEVAATRRTHPTRAPKLFWGQVAYGFFGLGYIAYATFVIAYLRNAGANDTQIIGFWILLGLAGVASTLIWPRLLPRSDLTLTATLAMCASSVAIVVVSSALPAAAISAVLFGGSFIVVVSAITGLVRERLPSDQWGDAISRITVIFGVGQVLGPVLAGLLGDTDAGLRIGLAGSVLALALGAIASLGSIRQPEAPCA